MIKNCVTVIPFSPAHSHKVGFYSLLAFTNQIAVSSGLAAIFPLNTYGKDVSSDLVRQAQCSSTILSINPQMWWFDTEITDQIIQRFVQKLIEAEVIRIEEKVVMRCLCGNVEYLYSAHLYGKKTLVRGSYALCCHSRIQSYNERVLITAPLPRTVKPIVFPLWADREFSTKSASLVGRQLLLSRASPRCFKVTNDGLSWYLDNDVIWWFYQSWLYRHGFSSKHLVAGGSVLQQAAIIHSITTLVGLKTPTHYYFLPKVFFEPTHNITNLEGLCLRFGRERIVNALLWCALSGRKEITLNAGLIPNMSKERPTHSFLTERNKLRVV